jgi:hypothetical protein
LSYGSKGSKKEGGRQGRAQAFMRGRPSTIFQSALPSPRCKCSANAELNRLDQACEVLIHTGVRAAKDSQAHRAGASGHYFGRARPLPADPAHLGKMVGHQGSAPRTPAWKTGVYLSTPMPAEMESRAGIAPASSALQADASLLGQRDRNWGDQPDLHRAQTPSQGVMLLLHHDHHKLGCPGGGARGPGCAQLVNNSPSISTCFRANFSVRDGIVTLQVPALQVVVPGRQKLPSGKVSRLRERQSPLTFHRALFFSPPKAGASGRTRTDEWEFTRFLL